MGKCQLGNRILGWKTDKNNPEVQKSVFMKINSQTPLVSAGLCKRGGNYPSGWRKLLTKAWKGWNDCALWAECESQGWERVLSRLHSANIHFSTGLSLWSTATGKRKRERGWKQRRKIKIHSWQRLSLSLHLGWAAHNIPTISKMP